MLLREVIGVDVDHRHVGPRIGAVALLGWVAVGVIAALINRSVTAWAAKTVLAPTAAIVAELEAVLAG